MRSFIQFCFLVFLSAFLFISCKKDDSSTPITQINFNTLPLGSDSIWNGSDLSGGFTCGNAYFINSYNTTYASWTGFAYTNLHDTITQTSIPDLQFQYKVFVSGNSSNISVIGYDSDTLSVYFNETHERVKSGSGNNTYTALSMKHGDSFAKKFTNKSKDWYMVTITGYNNAVKTDTVNVYLANYQFSDSTKDYILNTWRTVNLSGLGTVTKLSFTLSSSDNSNYGGISYMNTPAYFCLDKIQGVLQ